MRSDTALRHRIDDASVDRSSAYCLLLIAVAGLGMAYGWTRTQYFVGTDQDKVAIFQGLSEGLPGLSLSRVYEVQQLAVSELPPFYQEQVKANIDVASLTRPVRPIAELTEAAKTCQPTADSSAHTTCKSKPCTEQDTQRQADPVTLGARHWADGAELLIMRVVAPVTVVPRKRRGVELALIIFALGLTSARTPWSTSMSPVSCRRPSPTWQASASCSRHSPTLQSGGGSRADPVILPCVILLNGLGLVMIHRIDLINDPPLNGARQQLIWTAIGVLMFILVVAWLNDHRPLQRFTYDRPCRHRAAVAAGAGARYGEVRRADLDPRRSLQLPTRRGCEGLTRHRLRLLPGREARRAGARRVSHTRHRPARPAISARFW